MGPRVQLPPEIQLAQRLAGNEQVTRDRAVRKLRKYIVARTQRAEGGFSHDELLKVWKGLFYCMWMQDKPLLQEELGRTISQLVHAFQTTEAQHLFLQTFWQTMNREWMGIDRLRLDKFYMLMRMVLHESLKALKMRGWDERQTERLLELLVTEILHPDGRAPNGVKSHFIESFLEELTKVGAHELTADQNLRLIGPFCTVAARTQEPLVLHTITRGIFEAIVEQAPLAIEDLMNELEEEEEDGDTPSREPPEGSVSGAEPDPGEEQAWGDEEEDSAGTTLQFDYEAVADRLFEMASRQDTPPQNRKRLYKVIRKLQALSEGIFPEDDIPEKAYRNPRGGRRVRMKKRLSESQQLQNKIDLPDPSLPEGSREMMKEKKQAKVGG
ncbi:ribosomal RNA processing protein 1 homolog A isoform X3 [Kogia breviceps]|uniref:ribosomal RNA processing protein 1 homolog A isoform X3 n=1 Tax=Kogia breviceps TaxID=27615 RepID=UPI0027962F9B|nr:ribosomal RNA processing protein 1 homolog A isoform X4 [Kogia breviceps]